MAYASVISLKQTITRLLFSSKIFILHPLFPDILKSARNEATELKKFLQTRASISSSSSRRKKTDAFDGEIREAVRKLEDTLESHISNEFLISQYESVDGDMVEGQRSSTLSVDFEGVKQEVVSFTETMKKKLELSNLLLPDDDDDDEEEVVSSSTNITASFPGLMKSSKMVGLSYDCNKIKDMLRCPSSSENYVEYFYNCALKIMALLGMAGIGKTALALKVFEELRSDYELSAFVKVGPKCKTRETMLRILAQMNHINKISHEGDEIVAECLQTSLQNRKYLIVMDDVWNTEYWDEIKSTLPDNKNGSRVLLTTRRGAVARRSDWNNIHEMRFLNKQESWDLLRYNVFGTEESCPFELEKSGRKIAENCDGLPLAIVTVARFLSKVERTVVSWNKATNKQSLVFKDAHDEMWEVLVLSYEYLSLQLKACFQYMGVFPEDCEITFSKVAKLCVAERFIEENSSEGSSEYFIRVCLEELVSDRLVLVRKQSSTRRIKKFRLHFVYWHLCVREAAREKFLHIVNSLPNSFKQGVTSERRLCIYNNALFGFKEVYEHSTEDNVNSTVRSLLCTGPHHQYPIPVHLQYFRLLRVLDALTIRFYEFPIEIVKLVLLRYLALTSNRELPASISKLWNLEYLIIHQHLSIKSSGSACLYLPMEIWDMQKLEHLEVVGRDLPEPDPTYCGGGPLLPRLSTLLGVSPQSCIKGVLARIPNMCNAES